MESLRQLKSNFLSDLDKVENSSQEFVKNWRKSSELSSLDLAP